MALKPTTIRFAPDALDLVQRAADNLGISVAQFVRESSIMRAMFVAGEFRDDLEALGNIVTRLSRRDD
jgi:uncharacterized protein (DUF1778 family)